MQATPAGEGIDMAIGSCKIMSILKIKRFNFSYFYILYVIKIKSRNDREIILKNQLTSLDLRLFHDLGA